ncbi:LDL receptor repeat-containing protein egg-1-like [Bolinopsis microptera]|uniref:LDL receptor repeat-containing protein egg-1-like n=1 Tax=Bolinopsis microptera TaxID=2820187 RepID=UPI00307914F3
MDAAMKCDGVSHCDSDECDCDPATQPNIQLFYCPNTIVGGAPTRGGCITEQFLCNGYSHCPNDHDESLCYNVHTWVRYCPNDHDESLCYNVHTCKNEEYIKKGGQKEYVPNYRVCDGYYHCEDFSDEDPAVCAKYNVSKKEPRKYIRCLDEDSKPIKIKITERCNGKKTCYKQCTNYSLPLDQSTCTDWSDEDGCSEEEGEVEEAYVCEGEGVLRYPGIGSVILTLSVLVS